MSTGSARDRLQQLSRLIPLNTLKQELLEAVLQEADVETLGKDINIFEQNDVEQINIYLLDGCIGLFQNDRQMDKFETDSAASRFPVAHQLPRKYSAKTLTESTIARIDSRQLSEALAANEDTGYLVENLNEANADQVDWMEQLLQSRVMQQIPPKNLQSVMMRMQEQQVKAGEVIIKEGEEGNYYYLLHRGSASVFEKDKTSGAQIEVNLLAAGSAFGEEALLTDNPRSSTVQMITDGTLVRLSRNDFNEFIRHPLTETVEFGEAEKIIARGGIWLDVRRQAEFEQGHLPGAINLPHSALRFQLDSLDSERDYVVCSHSRAGGLASTYLLFEKGFKASPLDESYYDLLKRQGRQRNNHEELNKQPVARPAEQPESVTLQQLKEENSSLKHEISRLNEALKTQKSLCMQLKTKLDALQGAVKKV